MLKLGPYGKNKIMCRKEILYGEVILLYHYCKKIVHLHDYFIFSLCRRCFEVDTRGGVAGVFDGRSGSSLAILLEGR